MYLHQSNNLGINISSTHTSLTNPTLKMSDLHNDAFHNHHLKSNQTVSSPNSSSPKNHQLNSFVVDKQNEENYDHYESIGKLPILNDQFDYIETDKMNSLSCSPKLSISSTINTNSTLNNITNIGNFVSTNNKSSNSQPQLIDQIKQIDYQNDKLNASKISNFDHQNDLSVMDPLTRFLSLHPKYLELFDKFYSFLFNGDGSLKYTVRQYIAIMAAARHQCKYLVNDQIEQFKKVGGDVNWLRGLQYAPKKIQNLNDINKILAHQPWTLTKEHIERLTKGKDNWSVSELMQAIVIMTHFHSLASFVFGCGFNEMNADLEWLNKAVNLSPEITYSNNISDLLLFRNHVSSAPPSPPSNSLVNINSNLNSLLTESSLLKVSQTSSNLNGTNNSTAALNLPSTNADSIDSSIQQANRLDILMRKMQSISEQKQQQFESENQEELVKNQSLEIHLTPTPTSGNEFIFDSSPPGSLSAYNNTGQESNNQINNASPSQLTSRCLGNGDEQDDLSKFVIDSKFCYVDFAKKRALTDVTTFKVQDYSWSDHGYSLVNRLYSDVGTLLDEKFTIIYNLTYYTMGRTTNVDTRLFRQAIWNYIQTMYGIRHDDYHYHEINELLERQLKTYIKTVCCFPHQTLRTQCDQAMSEFRRSEKIHVNIMIAEAKLQTELLYALRTISRYMT